MTMNEARLPWSAIDAGNDRLPDRIEYERGVWGKAHGASSDYRWIARTPDLEAAKRQFARELPLAGEDAPVAATLWRVLGNTCYAIGLQASSAQDTSGRSGFVEKQIMEWQRSPEVPAILGALLLLPIAAQREAQDLWDQGTDSRWSEDNYVMNLPPSAPVLLTSNAIDEAVADGLRRLAEATTEEALAELYALLLAGNRGVPLRGLASPLPPTALAALLLPLPRNLTDTLSVAGWLPSTWLSASGLQDVRQSWNLVLGGATPISTKGFVEPTPEMFRQAREMAGSVFANVPAGTTSSVIPRKPEAAGRTVQLALWGPAASGKTALIAELFLDDMGGDPNWEIFPTERSIAFVQAMRERIRTGNSFPKATSVGQVEGIEYHFKHRQSGATASLQLEDRAGQDSIDVAENKEEGVSFKQRLGSADGVVLLFDALADGSQLESRVARTLELLYVASGRVGRRDERPIAVCISKADALVQTPADFRRAVQQPDDFVREQLDPGLLAMLGRYCDRYRLFPVSAAGVRLRYGAIEPVVFIDENLQPRICPGGRPFNLKAPFTWLLDELTGA
jgi:hypothetical protein